MWPGIVTVTGQGPKRKLDLKKPKGSDKARLTDEGYQNAKLKAELSLWEQAHWDSLQELLPIIHPRRKGGDRQPLQIIHPAANLYGIDNVYVTSLPIISLDRRTQIGTFAIELIEWVPAPKPVKRASGRKGGGGCADLSALTPEEIAALTPAQRACLPSTNSGNVAKNSLLEAYKRATASLDEMQEQVDAESDSLSTDWDGPAIWD